MKKETLLSPEGQVLFMALQKPFADENRGGKELYSIRLMFDSSIPEHATYKAQLEAINPALVGTKASCITKDGQFTVSARSNFAVQVTNSSGDALTGEDIPLFYSKNGTAKARMVTTIYHGGRQPSIPLLGVQITEITQTEQAKEINLDMQALKAALSQSHK